MRTKSFLALACLGLALSTTAASADTLAAKELRALAPGRYNVDIMGGMISMIVTLYPNGRIAGVAKGQKDSGTWQVRGTQMCIAWSKWLGGSNHCSALDDQGDKLRGSSFTIKHI
ncbi:hypothetical protein [Aestuariivirga litoralis]|uniref:hypothetical protein n=1 Tax=Aestuariivirga litoralis TaxID=2650924 RepID=UPI0018C60548|nr:hypothetical protein [Aestuariivirga litoralis]MBG1231650.1 hypothetical protein [Aestuariivirga litoralis]